jgi:hypothetical protein
LGFEKEGKGRGINIHFARHSTLCTLWGPALGTKIITCLCASGVLRAIVKEISFQTVEQA